MKTEAASVDRGLVSIVIPTYRRAHMVGNAVRSALAQTYTNIEVIVVADGPDDATRATLAELALADARLKYMELAVNAGPAEARNAGVRASRGTWLMFLDDDDEMLPMKAERQLTLADDHVPTKMVACRLIYQHDGREDIWPDRPMGPEEDIGDYILLRPSLLGRPGVLTMQSLLMHRSVCEAVPFRTHSEHEDWAWLLEIWHRTGVRIEFLWEALVTYSIETGRESRSRRLNWPETVDFADTYREWISDRAYSSLLSTKAALKAKRAGDWRKLPWLAGKVFSGRPSALDLMFLTGAFLVPASLLQAVWRYTLRSQSAKR